MLTITNLTKRFEDTLALSSVSLEVNKGEIVALIGPNSAGKSTLIKSVVGLLETTPNTIFVNGHDVTKKPEEAKKNIGYIPDEPSVWPQMTGEEFLMFTQAIYGVKESSRKHNIPDLLSIFSLEGLEGKTFEDYSRGNKQKFSIIAAMSHSPKLLLVDEPIVGLDPTGAIIAKNLFKEYADNGGAMLLVTHTLSVAEEIADKIGFIDNGKLIICGTLKELQDKAVLPYTASLESVYQKLLNLPQ